MIKVKSNQASPIERLTRVHRNQKGMAILSILAIILVITLYGTTSFLNVKKEMSTTFKELDKIRTQYAAQAAMAWAISIAKQDPAYSCPTHKANGTDIYVWNESGKTPDACDYDPQFTQSNYKLKSAGVNPIKIDSLGWMKFPLKAYQGDQTFTGADREVFMFKMWFNSDSTVRITALANVRSRPTSDILSDTLELFGELGQ